MKNKKIKVTTKIACFSLIFNIVKKSSVTLVFDFVLWIFFDDVNGSLVTLQRFSKFSLFNCLVSCDEVVCLGCSCASSWRLFVIGEGVNWRKKNQIVDKARKLFKNFPTSPTSTNFPHKQIFHSQKHLLIFLSA